MEGGVWGWMVDEMCSVHITPPPSGSLQSWFSWYFSQWFWIFAPFSYWALRLCISDYYSPHKHYVYCCLAFKIWRKRIFICINPWRPKRLIRIWVGCNCPRQQAHPPPSFTQSCNFFCFLPVCLCDAKCHWEHPNMSALVRIGLCWIPRLWKKDLNEGSFIVQVCVLHTRAFSLQ